MKIDDGCWKRGIFSQLERTSEKNTKITQGKLSEVFFLNLVDNLGLIDICDKNGS